MLLRRAMNHLMLLKNEIQGSQVVYFRIMCFFVASYILPLEYLRETFTVQNLYWSFFILRNAKTFFWNVCALVSTYFVDRAERQDVPYTMKIGMFSSRAANVLSDVNLFLSNFLQRCLNRISRVHGCMTNCSRVDSFFKNY